MNLRTSMARMQLFLRDKQDQCGFFSARQLVQAALTGSLIGGLVGLFRLAADHINVASVAWLRTHDIYHPLTLLGIFTALALLAAGSTWLCRRDPSVSGSGIPQVELTIAGHLPPMPRLHWVKIIRLKFTATVISLAGGLSVGREGPCIQMGAAVGTGVGQYCAATPESMSRYLIAGAAAGLTAAFGAPAAGLCFAFEEMKSQLRVNLLIFTATSTFTAWIVITFVFGFGPVFPFAHIMPLTPTQWWIIPILAVGMGALGALYNKVLLWMTLGLDQFAQLARLAQPVQFGKFCQLPWLGSLVQDIHFAWLTRHFRTGVLPDYLRMALPFFCTGLFIYAYPQALEGFGPSATALGHFGLPLATLLTLALMKMLFSCLSFASGAAGGLLMPILLTGALVGACATHILSAMQCITPEQSAIILMAAMTGLFASSVRAPLTGAALLTEMTRAFEHLPLLVVTAYLATYTAQYLGSTPVYDSLKQRFLANEAAATPSCSHLR